MSWDWKPSPRIKRNTEVVQYRISNAARTDIVDALRFSQRHFGEAARVRYQALILRALHDLASNPQHVGSQERDDIAPGLRSYHLFYSRQHSRPPQAQVKKPRHVLFYRVIDDSLIEVVRLLHDAMEVQLHLPAQ
nr:type II toxin-antitoxin system RelE/ParE family toxin [Pseudomonas sp. 50_B]